MRFEALPVSGLPAALRSMGYIVEQTGETLRILLPHAIVESLTTTDFRHSHTSDRRLDAVGDHARYARRHCDRNSICGCPEGTIPEGVRMIRKRSRDPHLAYCRRADAGLL
jgi:hypothetical protein